MIKVVLFDMDGVLVDCFDAWVAVTNDTARHFGYPPVDADVFRAVYGQPTEHDVAKFFPGRTVEEVEAYYGARFPAHAHLASADPQAAEVIEAVRARGLGVAVITNTLGSLARPIIAANGLSPDALVGGDEVPKAKPAPDMVHCACELLGGAASEAIVVGDSAYDREAAAAAGARFVGVHGIAGENAIGELSELPALLERLV